MTKREKVPAASPRVRYDGFTTTVESTSWVDGALCQYAYFAARLGTAHANEVLQNAWQNENVRAIRSHFDQLGVRNIQIYTRRCTSWERSRKYRVEARATRRVS